MSLTGKLARMVWHAESDADETYECKDCETRFTLDRQTCPDCGGCTIDRIDWDDVAD